MISRRSVLRHGATAALVGAAVGAVQCSPTEAPAAEHPDAALIALGAEFDRLFGEYRRMQPLVDAEWAAWLEANPRPKLRHVPNDHPYWQQMAEAKTPLNDQKEEISEDLTEIGKRMREIRATTLAGFAAKARTLRFDLVKFGDSPEPMSSWDWDDECLELFIRDAERAAGVETAARELRR